MKKKEVHAEEAAHGAVVQQTGEVAAPQQGEHAPAVFEAADQQAVEQPAVLGDHGAERDAREAEPRPGADAEGEQDARANVDGVDDQVHPHGIHGVLHPHEPAPQGHQGHGGRRRPDADEEVALRQDAYPGRRVRNQHHAFEEGPLECQGEEGGQQGEACAAQEDAPAFREIDPAEGLGRQAAGAGTQETESPVQQREHHRAHGDGADLCRRIAAQVARHGDVHHAHQGHGNPGQDAGHRQPQNLAVEGMIHRNFWSSSSMPR